MAGRSDPPEGGPGGSSGAGDEEYRSIVFDDSFVSSARLQEYSAEQRLVDHTVAVRDRAPEQPLGIVRTVPKQGLALAMIILLAFAAAIYLGANNPYQSPRSLAAGRPAGSTVALVPDGEVPGDIDVELLYGTGPVREFGVGPGGLELPDPKPTTHFSREQVMTALTLAKEYLTASALNPDVLVGGSRSEVRELLGVEQQDQFDVAMDGEGGPSWATDWLVRFDQDRVEMADPHVRVDGVFTFTEATDDMLEIAGHHVFVYALRSSESMGAPASLFGVRREVRFQFGKEELRDRNVVLRQVDTLAGPMACEADPADAYAPLLAGETASQRLAGGIDPLTAEQDRPVLCAALTPGQLNVT
ncbi:hypothetical protein SAMN06297387_117100 [Streptomyces zhaozhouensis]|uniref:Uncharacterized protein n=1 Tax=Streptomyces zhaozhouensis TaxID=1300267 RepID=A0A286E0X8_9ACTN|nr:hypothetical protein [Streptomyces zhaozhouensis]SOD64533.1 hypothetical protein SAMN06297387_117100 [Streptomyces zhaozhouensis]